MNLGVILIKKAGDGDSKKIKGCWDSIHVVEVQEKSSGRSAHYKLTSTSMLWLQTNKVRLCCVIMINADKKYIRRDLAQ